MKIRSALFTLVFIGVCSSAMAQWQWLDKDGRRVFSDRPPPTDILEKNILKRPGGVARAPDAAPADSQAAAPAPTSAKASAPSGDKELEAKKKQIEKQAADAEAAKRKAEDERIAKAKAESCSRAKDAMSTISSGVRLSTVNAAGEKIILDDAARASERARVQSIIDSDCR